MRVEVPFRMINPVGRGLVKAHGIRKGHTKDSVIGRSHRVKGVAKRVLIFIGKLAHARDMPLAADQKLERPNSPEGHEGDIGVILPNDSELLALLEGDVIA